MDAKEAYTSPELAPLLGISRQAVDARAKRESWQSRRRTGRGGGSEWIVASMPESTRLVIAARVCARPPASRPSALAELVKLKGKVRVRAEARTAVLLLARVFTVNSGLALTPAMSAFAARWNAGEIEAEPWVREALPALCKNSLINWEKAAQAEGVARLGGKYGAHRKGTGRIDSQPEVREIVLGMLTQTPDVQARLILEKLHADLDERDDIELPTLNRLQRWLKNWKSADSDVFLRVKSPDKWTSRHRMSCGKAYELIVRPNQRWEYDGTPADLLLADGKRYTIVGIIDVYSRRLKLEVAPRSTARTVANLTYRCLVDWGSPEEAVTDNGKEFVARHMQAIFGDLEILPTILPPFRPDLKPAIERVFRTFSHDILSLFPCYVGHNVATRQEIRERKTFAKRLMDAKQPAELSMAVTPEELQAFCDDWTDHVYAHRAHGGLNKKTPFEVQMAYDGEIRRIADEDKPALWMLLWPPAGKDGWCKVTKEGVRVESGQFVHPYFSTCVDQMVQVRLDPDDAEKSAAYIFTEEMEFLCRATNIKLMSADERRKLAIDTRRAHDSFTARRVRELRELAKKTGAEHAAEDIMAWHLKRAARIEAAAEAKSRDVTHSTTALEQHGIAALAGGNKAPQAHSEAIAAAREVIKVQMATPVDDWLPSSPKGRYLLCREFLEALEHGQEMSTERTEWARNYATSNEYAGFAMLYAIPRVVNE